MGAKGFGLKLSSFVLFYYSIFIMLKEKAGNDIFCRDGSLTFKTSF